MSSFKSIGPAKLSFGGADCTLTGEVTITELPTSECDCGAIPDNIEFTIEFQTSPAQADFCYLCIAPPEAYRIVEDGQERQMTDVEREAFKAGLAAPFN